MGGDHGPETVIGGDEIALVRHPNIRFVIYGNDAALRPWLEQQRTQELSHV